MNLSVGAPMSDASAMEMWWL